MNAPDPNIPSIEIIKTNNKLFGNNKAPANTKGVLGIKKSPRIKLISKYTTIAIVLN